MSSSTCGTDYTCQNDWATVPDTPSSRENGRTHGVCVTNSGQVVVFAQIVDGLLTYSAEGELVSATGGDRWLGAHGLTRVVEEGTEYLWLVDEKSCEVAKVTLDGRTVQTLARPDHPVYKGREAKRYIPTWAAANPANGDVWVANGYGSSPIHRYDRSGTCVQTINGEEGAGRFNCPHGIAFGPDGNLWIADRANARITIYDGEGNYLRHRDGVCHSPCCFDFHGGRVLVPELFTGVKLLDQDLNLLAELGGNPEVRNDDLDKFIWPPTPTPGWPNWQGTERVRSGFFNSPHGGCFGPDGSIYVVEWIVGGRITKLSPA